MTENGIEEEYERSQRCELIGRLGRIEHIKRLEYVHFNDELRSWRKWPDS